MDALAQEQAQHRLWKLKPEFESFRAFDALLENEFRPPEQHRKHLAVGVRNMVRFAVEQTPYYALLFAKLGLRPEDIDNPDDLAKLPTLTKHDLLEFQQDLQARSLPRGARTGID